MVVLRVRRWARALLEESARDQGIAERASLASEASSSRKYAYPGRRTHRVHVDRRAAQILSISRQYVGTRLSEGDTQNEANPSSAAVSVSSSRFSPSRSSSTPQSMDQRVSLNPTCMSTPKRSCPRSTRSYHKVGPRDSSRPEATLPIGTYFRSDRKIDRQPNAVAGLRIAGYARS